MNRDEQILRNQSRITHCIGVGLVVALLFCTWYFVWVPMGDTIERERVRLKGQADYLVSTPVSVEAEARLALQHAEVLKRVAQLEARIPRGAETDGFVDQLDKLARAAGFRMKMYSPRGTSQRKKWSEQQFELSGEGKFSEVCRFLDGIHEMHRLCRLHELRIAAVGNSENILCTIRLSAYFARTDTGLRVARSESGDIL